MAPHTRIQQALPLHLTLAMLPLLASRAALQLWKNGSEPLNMPLPGSSPHSLRKLLNAWQNLQNDQELAKAVEHEAEKRTAELLTGVSYYNSSGFERDVSTPPVAMRVGNARLLDYGALNAHVPVVFLIPSLINRYYILDLTRKLSFARYLREQGMRVFIADWGAPSDTERHFNCALYITEILVPMAEWIRANTKGRIIHGGYCMGGLLALALAQLRSDLVNNLALFATPWDFSATHFPRFDTEESVLQDLKHYIQAHDEIPHEFIHTLFHYANPEAFQNKLREFSHMDPKSAATLDFLAIEEWVNDGVAMTRGVAEDCLIHWAQQNLPAKSQWQVGGQIINPDRLNIPCFIAAPQDDRIVPSACALPLANLLNNCTTIEPRSGHVGMMAGRNRKSALWEPFSKWIGKAS